MVAHHQGRQHQGRINRDRPYFSHLEKPMNDQRRTILKGMTAMAAASITGIASAKSGYDPKAKFDLKVSEVPFRKNAKGRQLMARIYQPAGAGPFPVVLDLH